MQEETKPVFPTLQPAPEMEIINGNVQVPIDYWLHMVEYIIRVEDIKDFIE